MVIQYMCATLHLGGYLHDDKHRTLSPSDHSLSFCPATKRLKTMELTSIIPTFKISLPNTRRQARTHVSFLISPVSYLSSPGQMTPTKTHFNSSNIQYEINTSNIKNVAVPTMSEVLAASKAQNLDLQLQTLGPFFRITAKSLETQNELGRAEGLIRVWLKGKILHLDSIRLRRETLGMEKSIFGIGLFIGAVAIRHGYDSGCKTAELLAINDSDLYHSKLVRFYARIGFKAVYEVTGSTIGDLPHLLVWGGIGTRMDADVEELLIKWCARFKSRE